MIKDNRRSFIALLFYALMWTGSGSICLLQLIQQALSSWYLKLPVKLCVLEASPLRQCGYCVWTSQSSCFRRTSLLYSNPKFRPPEWHVLHERNQPSHGFAATEILAKGYQNCFSLSANSSSFPVKNTIRLLSPQSLLSQIEQPWYPSRLPRPGYSNSAWTIRIQAPDMGQLYRYLAHANRC